MSLCLITGGASGTFSNIPPAPNTDSGKDQFFKFSCLTPEVHLQPADSLREFIQTLGQDKDPFPAPHFILTVAVWSLWLHCLSLFLE